MVDKCYFVIAIKPEVLPSSDLEKCLRRKADLIQLVGHFKPRLDCRKVEDRQGKDPDYYDYPV